MHLGTGFRSRVSSFYFGSVNFLDTYQAYGLRNYIKIENQRA